MPYIGKQLVRGQNRKLDDISSGFNGSQTTFTLQVASQNVTVGSALQLWISLGGVIQDPLSDYTIAGNQITFTTAPAASLDFFGVIQGDVTDTNTPGDATVTTSKLSTGLTVNLADGSAATSSLQLGGTDSGLFSSAADKVNVTTGGVERLEIGDSEVVFNDPSNDVDFRVESNGNANMLFVDGGNDRVGIGTSSPAHELHVADASTPELVVEDTTNNCKAYLGSSDTNGRIGTLSNHDLAFRTNDTERMRIDSSGNVGINNSSPNQALHITTSGAGQIRIADGSRAAALGSTGSICFVGAVTSGQGFAFFSGNSERMRIDSSGRLMVASTGNSGANLFVAGGSGQSAGTEVDIARFFASTASSTNSGGLTIGGVWHNTDVNQRIAYLQSEQGNNPGSTARYLALNPGGGNVGVNTSSPGRTFDVDGVIRSDGTSGAFALGGNSSTPSEGCAIHRPANNTMAFVTGTSERMRIDSSGNIGIGTTSISARLALNGTLRFQTGNNPIGLLTGDGDGTNCFKFDSNSGVGNGSGLVRFFNNGTQKARIEGDGSFQSATNSYGALSDISLKENIVDANLQWSDIKNIQVRNYNFKEAVGHGTSTHLGVIAQEVESVSPGLVKTDSDGVKSVRYSVLYMKAVKALQEAMDRIETLEAKVAALEAE